MDAAATHLDCLPLEMVDQEVWRRLDVTSRGLWRVAWPALARRVPQPRRRPHGQPIKEWSCAGAHTSLLVQAAYDNHVNAVARYLGALPQTQDYLYQDWLTITARAAIQGAATDVWHRFDALHVLSAGEIVYAALCYGRLAFLRGILHCDEIMIRRSLATFYKDYYKSRGERPMRSVLVEAASRHCEETVHFIIQGVGWYTSTAVHACAAYNCCIAEVLPRYPECCNLEMILYIVMNGDRTEGLDWLEQHHPQVLQRGPLRHRLRKGNVLKTAARRGHVCIFQWLAAHGLLDMQQDYHIIAGAIATRGYVRLRRWAEEEFVRQDVPVPAAWDKLCRAQ